MLEATVEVANVSSVTYNRMMQHPTQHATLVLPQ